MSQRAHSILSALSIALFVSAIIAVITTWTQQDGSELYSPSSYRYRFQIEQSFDFNQGGKSQDYCFALIPSGHSLDTLQVRIRNGAPKYSYVLFTDYYSGKYIAESDNNDSTAVLHPPLLIENSADYPDIVIPIMYKYKSPQLWYLENAALETSPEEHVEADSIGMPIKARKWTLVDYGIKRTFEAAGPTENLISQDVELLAGGDLDPRIPGSEIIAQVTLVSREWEHHRSQIRCYHLETWRELWCFDVPCGVIMYQGLNGDDGKLLSHLFVLRRDNHENEANGMVDTNSYALKLDLDGCMQTEPLRLESSQAAWMIENSYPLPGTTPRFLMYGSDMDSEYSFLEIRDSETLEVLSHQAVGFAEGCFLVPSHRSDPEAYQIILFKNQISFLQYNEQLKLQREILLSEPSRILFWSVGLRGKGFTQSGTHFILGGVQSGRLILLGPDFEILSADRIQEKPLGTRCTKLLYQSPDNPFQVFETDYDTWYLNFNNTSVKGHYTRRPVWFLSYIRDRYPIPALLFLAAILVYLFGHLVLFRQRWQFYSTTVNTLFRNSLDAILICDSSGKVLAENHGFRELIGVDKSVIKADKKRGWPFALKKTPPSPAIADLLRDTQLETLYSDAFVDGTASGTVELIKKNQPATYSFRLEKMRSRGAKETSILILHDITEQLEETKRTIWKFMSQNTAHRLKSPLQRIKTVAESTIIKRQKGKLQIEEVDQNLQKILSTTRDVDQMIHDFLMVSDRKIRPRELDIRRFLMKNIQYYRQKNISEGVQLILSLAEELPAVIADDYHLLTLLVNLLDNSLKAVKGEGTITVSAEPFADTDDSQAKWLRLKIEDDGVGIPPELLPRIFQHHASFFKEGHGVGLAVAYSIVQAHEGRISVDSTVGKGTVFQVDLPLVEQSLQ